MVERRVSDQKVAHPGSIPELARCRYVNGKTLRFFPLGPSSLPVVGVQPDECFLRHSAQLHEKRSHAVYVLLVSSAAISLIFLGG